MSSTTHFEDALEAYAPTTSTKRPARLLAGLRTAWVAIGEGLAASRRYRELTLRGMRHEQAVSKVFSEHFSG